MAGVNLVQVQWYFCVDLLCLENEERIKEGWRTGKRVLFYFKQHSNVSIINEAVVCVELHGISYEFVTLVDRAPRLRCVAVAGPEELRTQTTSYSPSPWQSI